MIFDRTKEDVENAQNIFDEKVKNFLNLTEEEIETLERGRITKNTLNRIEEKQKVLMEEMQELGYFNSNVENFYWSDSDIFYSSDLDRIFSNTEILRRAFLTNPDTPKTPKVAFYFDYINKIERILYDLGVSIEYVKCRIKRCGTFNCGEVFS